MTPHYQLTWTVSAPVPGDTHTQVSLSSTAPEILLGCEPAEDRSGPAPCQTHTLDQSTDSDHISLDPACTVINYVFVQ